MMIIWTIRERVKIHVPSNIRTRKVNYFVLLWSVNGGCIQLHIPHTLCIFFLKDTDVMSFNMSQLVYNFPYRISSNIGARSGLASFTPAHFWFNFGQVLIPMHMFVIPNGPNLFKTLKIVARRLKFARHNFSLICLCPYKT